MQQRQITIETSKISYKDNIETLKPTLMNLLTE
jgi:hypothetical protein